MTIHLTVRLAWHDNRWDGTICRYPAENAHCCGTHSLLSERIARDKSTSTEQRHPGAPLDSLLPQGYLPPCYWSSCAFASKSTKIVHAHPFANYRDTKTIPETLPPTSVYTWPFRLTLTHTPEAFNKHGQYPVDLDDRVDRFFGRLRPRDSLVFFYLNYDNPVSADDGKYAVVGCARMSDVARSGEFVFSDEELQGLRKSDKMRNFPTRNWAARISYDFQNTGVRLPYHEYLEYLKQNPDDESKLEEIKVLVDEPSLLPGFKYVCEQVSDDSCLFLLYRLRQALRRVDEHGIAANVSNSERIDSLLTDAWKGRGLYPGLVAVVSLLIALRDGEPSWENAVDGGLVESIVNALEPSTDLLEHVFSLLKDRAVPAFLDSGQKKLLRQARQGLSNYGHLEGAFKKLALFDLTPRQVSRILFPTAATQRNEAHPFGGKDIVPADVVANPYLLCEEYVPATSVEKERLKELDREVRTDSVISYLTIDVGMFPDDDFVDDRNDDLQDLSPLGPERLRAFFVEALHKYEGLGHTFATLETLLKAAQEFPLFYRTQVALANEHVMGDNALPHFLERLHLVEHDADRFFYLQETWDAERIVERFVSNLISQSDHHSDTSWVEGHLAKEASLLEKQIPAFESEQFTAERRQLIEGALRRRFFAVTGRPGSGKTRALREVIARLRAKGEPVTVLAPTGKATLRVRAEAPEADVETIDRWINRCGLRRYLDNLATLVNMQRSQHYVAVANLVIDEMSMVDLPKLAVLARTLEVHEPGILRVILVGDEHQLPPIGPGRPFYDILAHLEAKPERAQRHTVRLRSNCRQKQDTTVVDAARLFAGKNRYFTDLYGRLLSGGEISKHLNVEYWDDFPDLVATVSNRLDDLLGVGKGSTAAEREKAMNAIFKLHDTGFVKDMREEGNELKVDAFQLLSPYRGGGPGTIALNAFVRERYRGESYPTSRFDNQYWPSSAFAHSDKIMCIRNHYLWNKDTKQKELRLSNGSIGVLCSNKRGRLSYFPEADHPFRWDMMDEDDFELAYAISVHKAQGSEFAHVFVVIPERRALLARELVYTAMTRSTGPLTLFVQRTPRENPLQIARERSNLLGRNSSLFQDPMDARRILEPESGVKVKSKIEYMIYTALMAARERGELTFAYELERDLPFVRGPVPVKPDFTLWVGEHTYFWEHLGRLDLEEYTGDWRERKDAYAKAGLSGQLITTDDLCGVRSERINQIIAAIVGGDLSCTVKDEWSEHHFVLS